MPAGARDSDRYSESRSCPLGRVILIVIQRADRARSGRKSDRYLESKSCPLGARESDRKLSSPGVHVFLCAEGQSHLATGAPFLGGEGSISVIPISARLNTTFDGVWCCPEPVVHSIDRCYPLTPVAKMAWEWAFRGLSPKSWAMALATASMISSAGALARSLIS